MDTERFEAVKNNVLHSQRERYGIGTLQEKTVHAVLKDYYAPSKAMQEIPLEGYVADIYTGEEIIEIQTAHFDKMRRKLECFLPLCPVTIVYPVAKVKWLSWIDQESGECSALRKSPVKGSVYRAFYELYKIKSYLSDPNLRLCFPMLEIQEYRLLNGWSKDRKKGSCRYDRIPVSLMDEVCFQRREDYVQLIPYELAEPFTAAEFAQAVREPTGTAGRVLHILHYLHIVERCENRGRAYTYRVVEPSCN